MEDQDDKKLGRTFTITKDLLFVYLIYFKKLIFLAGRGLNF